MNIGISTDFLTFDWIKKKKNLRHTFENVFFSGVLAHNIVWKSSVTLFLHLLKIWRIKVLFLLVIIMYIIFEWGLKNSLRLSISLYTQKKQSYYHR